MRKKQWLFWAIIILTAFFDQVSKYLVAAKLELYTTVPVLSGFFNIVNTRNRGMAFGFLNTHEPGPAFYFLTCASIFAVIIIIFWFFRLKGYEKPMVPGLAMITGGASGNLIDRLRIGEVIDFLDVQIGTYHWPAFNIADASISVGTIWVAVCLLFIINPDKK